MPLEPNSKVVMFVNWSKESFVGLWNSVAYPFKAGEKKYMEAWKALHFAKHLANRELLRDGFENDTSPKTNLQGKSDNIRFNEYLNRAVVDAGFEGTESEVQSEVIDRNMRVKEEEGTVFEDPNQDEEEKEEVKEPVKTKKELEKEAKEKAKADKKAKKSSDEDEFEGLED